MKSMKFSKLKTVVAGVLLVCISAGASVAFAQPTSMGHLLKYTNIGVRNLAPTYEPYAGQAVQGLGNKFKFVAASGAGIEPPYFNDATQTGDVALLEGNWGILDDDNYGWVGKSELFNQINNTYIVCNDPKTGIIDTNKCNSTNKKALFALIRFNNDWLNKLWNDEVDQEQTVNGHKITIGDVRQHLIAHEFGHVIGMGHEGDVCPIPQTTLSTSVMQAGVWCKPFFTGYASSDVTWFSARY